MNISQGIINRMRNILEGNDRVSIYASDGVRHFWPEIPNWSLETWDVSDVFGNVSKAGFQHDLSFAMITADAHPIETSLGNGTYVFEYFGKTKNGIWKHESELSAIFKKIEPEINKIFSSTAKKLPKKVGRWIKNDFVMGDISISYTKEIDSDTTASVDFLDYDNAIGSNISSGIIFSVIDTGGYRSEGILSDDNQEWKSIGDISKKLKMFDKIIKNKLGK